jgi:hypothetical protein
MRTATTLFALAFVVGAALDCGGSVDTSSPPKPLSAQIAFRDDSAQPAVYVARIVDGVVSPATKLVDTSDWFSSICWSPDGARVAFARGGEIWSIGADGNNETRIASPPSMNIGYSSPAFGPDGVPWFVEIGGTQNVPAFRLLRLDPSGGDPTPWGGSIPAGHTAANLVRPRLKLSRDGRHVLFWKTGDMASSGTWIDIDAGPLDPAEGDLATVYTFDGARYIGFGDARWSPRSDRVYFVTGNLASGGATLNAAANGGGDPTATLTFDPGDDPASFDMTVDGRFLIATSAKDLKLIDLGGAAQTLANGFVARELVVFP